ncbi:MAG: leucine-rich repeat domain-containing protein [Oscillospiraceae bacterium]|nr:leucine-rich repeat domain-containing protein [Oscillospiraceae bacterium]
MPAAPKAEKAPAKKKYTSECPKDAVVLPANLTKSDDCNVDDVKKMIENFSSFWRSHLGSKVITFENGPEGISASLDFCNSEYTNMATKETEDFRKSVEAIYFPKAEYDYFYDLCNLAEFPSLKYLYLSDSLYCVEIFNMPALTEVRYPSKYDYFCLCNCPSLNVSFSEIRSNAKVNLTNVQISGDVYNTSDRDISIENCPSLKSFTSTSTRNKIQIKKCPSLEYIDAYLSRGIHEDYNEYFKNYTSLKKANIRFDYIEEITSMFSGCTSLESVSLEGTVKCLSGRSGAAEDGFFGNCTSLREVKLPDSVTYITSAFKNCTSLEEITLPAELEKIHEDAFAGCTSLRTIHIPMNAKIINRKGEDSSAFCDCSASIIRY